ncbi:MULTISPECIES: hypothetical protein [Haloferax]|uniref:Lipoprotein n=2 Tax=Haloferax TaxID=2251 RepID=A0A6G1YYE0_9EURY|nr:MULTISPECIES: hypothetical protein [Haloferax]KAB1186689.1 hypothetical protein Hfx1149_01050 [Haloferax sp. CBA1149]MRW79310.1 hypothetical protein [Haloferax marinisediminis]
MKRRAILAGVAGVCVSLAGCAADDDTDDRDGDQTTTETTSTTPTPTPSEPVLVEQSLSPVPTDDCPTDGRATVPAVAEGVITVEGCLWGANGCSVVRLAAADYDSDSNTATVVIQTVEDVAPDEGCTQALVPLGYRAQLRFSFQLPAAIEVVHDDVNGRRTLTRRELDT